MFISKSKPYQYVFYSGKSVMVIDNIKIKIQKTALFKDYFQSVLPSLSTLMFVYKHYKFPLDGMQINAICFEAHTLSLRPFKFFF